MKEKVIEEQHSKVNTILHKEVPYGILGIDTIQYRSNRLSL